MKTAQPSILILALLGALTGLLSGLFGVGGGILLVPLLVGMLGFEQRLAAGTSIAAILPAATIGAISYGIQGNVDWLAAAALAIGMVLGAQVGSYLLARAPIVFLRWLFMVFLLGVVISLWFVVPQRGDSIEMTVLLFIVLVATGLATGIASGLLGVGGGVIIVPVLMFFFGASDLVAKGTSLVMLVPGSVSGTLANSRRRNVDMRSAVVLGIAASVLAPVGSLVAANITPFVSNALFSILLGLILIQMLVRTVRPKKK